MILFNKYKVVNIKRFRIFLLISFILLFTVVNLIFSSFTKAYSMTELKIEHYYVKPGDNLWSIAKEFSNNITVDKLINKISKINNLKNNTIYPGDILFIPIY